MALSSFDDDTQRRIVFFKNPPVDGQEDNYQKAFRDAGFKTEFVPTLSFAFCNGAKLKQAVYNPEHYNGLLLTSQRAVDAIANCLSSSTTESTDSWASKWNERIVCAVGAATTNAASDQLGLVCQLGESGNADQLADQLITGLQQGNFPAVDAKLPFLFPCGDLRRDVLISKLHDASYAVEELVCYETIAHPALADRASQLTRRILTGREVATGDQSTWLVFFSPSGVSFCMAPLLSKITTHLSGLAECGSGRSVQVAAIGKTTASALGVHDISVDAVAEKPSAECLLSAVMTSN